MLLNWLNLNAFLFLFALKTFQNRLILLKIRDKIKITVHIKFRNYDIACKCLIFQRIYKIITIYGIKILIHP